MTIEISPEAEARLTDEARRQGISVGALVERIINQQAAMADPSRPNPELPVWHLGAVGALHRRDIYNDVR